MSTRHPDQFELFAEVIESLNTRDAPFVNPDGAWGTRRARPLGAGWRLDRDRERHSAWVRRFAMARTAGRLKRRLR